MKTKHNLAIATIGLASFATSVLGAELSAKASALPEELRQGLILYYSFDNELSAREIADESGEGNDGKIVNVEWIKDGHQGGAASFGPTNCYITVPNKDSINPPILTLSTWIKTSYKDGVWRRIFDKDYAKGYVLSMGGDTTNGKPRWRGQVCLEAGKMWVPSGIQVTDGQWRHVVSTFDGVDAKIYVDGWPVNRAYWKGDIGATSCDLTIGGNRSNQGAAPSSEYEASFYGMMDDVMMFNRALSADEVQALFKVQGGTLGPKPEKSAPRAKTLAKPDAQNKLSVDDRLKQLKQLLDQGLINKEDYDRKMKEIVDSI